MCAASNIQACCNAVKLREAVECVYTRVENEKCKKVKSKFDLISVQSTNQNKMKIFSLKLEIVNPIKHYFHFLYVL